MSGRDARGAMADKKKTTRKCLRCGAPEKVDSAGYSNLTQYVGP